MGEYIYGLDDTTLEKAVGELLKMRYGDWLSWTPKAEALITRITDPTGSEARFRIVASSCLRPHLICVKWSRTCKVRTQKNS